VKLAHKATYTDGDYAVGLNWQMLSAGGRRVIWQDGAVPGYASFCILQPEANLALVILSNELGPTTLGRLSVMANQIMTSIDARSVIKP
jgi:D-alanyl-D-alanine-carboxypeptidase/D-alanyl-D-alanine-endopeptidase